MPGGRPVNLGLVEALSRIGGPNPAQLPTLLDGIQPVFVYGDISKTLASEVFEARAVCGRTVTGNPVFQGFELACRTPGGLVVEQISMSCVSTGTGTLDLALNIRNVSAGGSILPKLDCGGIATLGQVRALAAPVAFSATVPLRADTTAPVGSGAAESVEIDLRAWVPPGEYFVCFPAVTGGVVIDEVGLTLVWRELSDVQGTP